MNHFCECGHLPSYHYGEKGRCEADIGMHDPCTCPLYAKDSDD